MTELERLRIENARLKALISRFGIEFTDTVRLDDEAFLARYVGRPDVIAVDKELAAEFGYSAATIAARRRKLCSQFFDYSRRGPCHTFRCDRNWLKAAVANPNLALAALRVAGGTFTARLRTGTWAKGPAVVRAEFGESRSKLRAKWAKAERKARRRTSMKHVDWRAALSLQQDEQEIWIQENWDNLGKVPDSAWVQFPADVRRTRRVNAWGNGKPSGKTAENARNHSLKNMQVIDV